MQPNFQDIKVRASTIGLMGNKIATYDTVLLSDLVLSA